MDLTRRSVLKRSAGAVSLGAFAGCLSSPDSGGGEGGYASFFALWDWANQVGGDEMAFENPIDAGEMGHGWEPDGNLAPEIASSEAFVYLDTPEFSWAQDIVSDLERDYDDSVTVIDGLEGLGPYLLPFDAEPVPEPDTDHDFVLEDLQLDEFDHVDLRSNEVLGYWHIEHWHGGIPDVPLDESVPIGVVIEDTEGRVLPLGADEQFQLDARLADGAEDGVVEIESNGDHVAFHGTALGSTAVILQLRRDGEVVFETDEEALGVDVVEELSEGADEFHDPHVWVDPVLAQRIVETIADALTETDPDNEDTYRENATAYIEQLSAIDDQLRELTETAQRDVAVFVGHDSFQYLEHRYGFDFRTPVGISPNERMSPSAVADLIDVIETHDINTILYDPFETGSQDEIPSEAQTLLEESDATNAEPITPMSGTTREWQERDWGYLEQMREINIPSLQQALDE
ncbi:metal ABC transporter substrate-binding protein [Natronorubrum thiooxidans]|uniref:Zinc transport system substrate-binding protein n=1 Tax=Natronorubrum thiooxidans TaxID=308853 RepID=A0A1N7ELW3_9EURY|nr:metal ABC transporter substrate-binding protein [Natronorubrum thiooxidans]SIR89052.1 zinc transport system substrate-binding protein [Natronorubrum thiooxidans]